MIPVSDDYKRVTQSPHDAIARVDIYLNDVFIMSLPIHDGSVDSDRNADIRGRFDCKISDPTGSLVPKGIRDILAPFGTVLKIFKGVRIPVIIQVTQVFNTDADWNSGTKTRTAADNGDLIIL